MSGTDDSAEAENQIAAVVDAAGLDGLVERQAQVSRPPHSVNEPESRAPDPSDALPLIDRLLRVAGDHDGKFVVAGIGEDPDTDGALTPEIVHVSNRQADRRGGLMAAIKQVSRCRGANAYEGDIAVLIRLADGFAAIRREREDEERAQ